MPKYCLSINILSSQRELLDKLMLTLETQDGDMSALEGVEIRTSDSECLDVERQEADMPERGVALEHWFLPDGL